MDKEKIIVALDVADASKAREIIAELRDEVGAFKIGLQLFTAAGASIVREAVRSGNKLFLDLKFHDIPNTVAQASKEVARLGVWMFNVHALGGAEMMRRAAEEMREACDKENLVQPKIIGVTVLTSADRATLREVGIETETEKQVAKLAALAAQCHLDGVVASPLEIQTIRRAVEKRDFLIVTPGIRNSDPQAPNPESRINDRKSKIENQIETIDDQKRVMTATEAIAAGADYLVVGRPILRAEDRIAAARRITATIAAA